MRFPVPDFPKLTPRRRAASPRVSGLQGSDKILPHPQPPKVPSLCRAHTGLGGDTPAERAPGCHARPARRSAALTHIQPTPGSVWASAGHPPCGSPPAAPPVLLSTLLPAAPTGGTRPTAKLLRSGGGASSPPSNAPSNRVTSAPSGPMRAQSCAPARRSEPRASGVRRARAEGRTCRSQRCRELPGPPSSLPSAPSGATEPQKPGGQRTPVSRQVPARSPVSGPGSGVCRDPQPGTVLWGSGKTPFSEGEAGDVSPP